MNMWWLVGLRKGGSPVIREKLKRTALLVSGYFRRDDRWLDYGTIRMARDFRERERPLEEMGYGIGVGRRDHQRAEDILR